MAEGPKTCSPRVAVPTPRRKNFFLPGGGGVGTATRRLPKTIPYPAARPRIAHIGE